MLQAVINNDSLMRRRLCDKLHGRRRICCSHSISHRSIASHSSRIAIFPHLHSTPPLRRCMQKLPDDENILRIRLLVLTEFTNVTDGRTDRHTPHDGIGRACIASRVKKPFHFLFFSYSVPW